MTLMQDNLSPYLTVVEQSSTPASPSAGDQKLFVRTSDHLLCYVNSSGVVTPVSTGSALTTKGDLLGYSTTPARVPIGTDGQVLTADSTQTLGLKWAAASGGGALVLLEQHTASTSASLDFTTAITSTYDTYVFKFIDVLPATSTSVLWMRMGTGAGPTWDAGASYGSQLFRHSWNASALSGADSGANQIPLTTKWLSTGSHAIGGSLELYGPGDTTYYKFVAGKFVYPDSDISNMCVSEMGGQYNVATAVTGVRFLMSSGNITSGTIRCYGVAKS